MNKNFYKPKLICIARCKNEMHIIEKWYDSLPFVDLFIMTDNNSTDGTYEYLKTKDNVIVTSVEDFDEGRDFQILLKMAKAHDPEWLLKIDCDEIFEDLAIKNFPQLLNQKDVNAVYFRRMTFDYRLPDSKYRISKKSNLLLLLSRNTKNIDILNVKSHVGYFRFYKKPVISNFRLKHYSLPSYEKALEKYETYMKMKSSNDVRPYDSVIDCSKEYIDSIPKGDFNEPENLNNTVLSNKGYNLIEFQDGVFKIVLGEMNKNKVVSMVKFIFFGLVKFFSITTLVLWWQKRKHI